METSQSLQAGGPVTELGEFLRSRRDRISPDDAGIDSYGRRRVPGLRREELAQLAGVSVTYLTRLEQGQSQNASDAIIDAQFADDRRLAELVGELSMNSPEFARLWAGHDVRLCTNGAKRFRHPEVGEMTLGYEVLHLPEGNGQRILTHTAEPGSASFAALRLLTAV